MNDDDKAALIGIYEITENSVAALENERKKSFNMTMTSFFHCIIVSAGFAALTWFQLVPLEQSAMIAIVSCVHTLLIIFNALKS